MCLKISREDLSWTRNRRALPIFLLLWFGGLVLALTYLFTIRIHLHSIEENETERLLDSYLLTHRGSSRLFGYFHLQQQSLPQGLHFLRLVQGSEQMLILGEDGENLSFKELADFPPDKSGVWLILGERKEHDSQRLTIITRRLSNGTLLQVGKDGGTGYELFRKLTMNTIFIMVGSIAALWPLSLYLIQLSFAPLVATRKKLKELLTATKADLLPEEGSGPELDLLYRQMNLLLQQNRHLVSEMQHSLDSVAHDLRTPMTRLRSVAEYGLQAEDDTARLRESLSDCLEESERVLAMLRIMMSVAEAESGTMRLEKVECDLAQNLKQVVTLYEYVAEEASVEVKLQTEAPLTLFVDETRIGQVWANLLDNSIKYGHEGGFVKIRANRVGTMVEVAFEDDGMGISESECNKIWERLYRGDRSRSKKGLGLGLNYARAVILAHGGTIDVNSTLHQGSCFTVQLPLAQVSTQEKSQISGE